MTLAASAVYRGTDENPCSAASSRFAKEESKTIRSQSSRRIDAQRRPNLPYPMTATDRAGMSVISRAFYVPLEIRPLDLQMPRQRIDRRVHVLRARRDVKREAQPPRTGDTDDVRRLHQSGHLIVGERRHNRGVRSR